MRISSPIAYLLTLFLASGLSACSAGIVKTEQPAQTSLVSQYSQNSIGQTFTSQYAGLQGIRLKIDPLQTDVGTILLHLRTHPGGSDELRTAWMKSADPASLNSSSFIFLPIRDSSGHDYFLELETQGKSRVILAAGPADSYLHGALYENGAPQESQLYFDLIYDPLLFVGGILLEVWGWIPWIAAAVLLFIIPGWVTLSFIWPEWERLLWAEKIGLASGLSVAAYPVVLLWSNLAGFQSGVLIAWFTVFFGILVFTREGWKMIRRRDLTITFLGKSNSQFFWYEMILCIVILLIVGTRFWVIRSLGTPLWGDGYQHTMITQLIVDHKGLFDVWLPYAELSTFTYHFGFHSASAVFHWISGLNVSKSVLYTGQIINALAVIGLYALSMRVTRNQWAALFSVLTAGLLFTLPMFYVNWSRYTQLAGQVILVAVTGLIWYVMDDQQFRKGMIFLTGLTFGGLVLTHYRVAVLALVFIPAWFVLNFRQHHISLQIKKIFWIGTISLLITLPWLINILSGRLGEIARGQINSSPGAFSDLGMVIDGLSSYLPMVVWIVLPIIVVWGLIRRERGLTIIVIWWILIFLVTNPDLIGLPGSGLITNFTVFIAAYIPAGLMLGSAFGWLIEDLQAKDRTEHSPLHLLRTPIVRAVGFSLLIAVSLLGAKSRLSDLEIGQHILATRPDLRASEWIMKNLPEEARFVVNSFFAYNGNAVVGSDGGWWLPLTANRLSSQPPLNYASEEGLEPDFYQSTNSLIASIEDVGIDDPEVQQLLLENGYTHVFVGQLQGSVNSYRPLLDPQALLHDPHFRPVYHQDRVWIFAIDR